MCKETKAQQEELDTVTTFKELLKFLTLNEHLDVSAGKDSDLNISLWSVCFVSITNPVILCKSPNK